MDDYASFQLPCGAIEGCLTLVQEPASTTTITYDGAGNLTSELTPFGNIYFTWDAPGRMVNVEPVGGVVTFTYNADHQQVGKTSYDGSTTGYLYNFNNLLQETDGIGGDIDKTYTAMTDEPYGDLISEHGDSELYHQHDAQWSTNALSDDAGNSTAPIRNTAFGLSASNAGEAWTTFSTDEWSNMSVDNWADFPVNPPSNMGGFGGEKQYYLIGEIGWYMLGMGVGGSPYNPTTGRFGSESRMRQARGDNNLYPIPGNDPINNNDPYGYCFPAGTKILLADHPPRNIEEMDEHLRVWAALDTDPESTPTPCHVLKVFRNAPAPILHVQVGGEVIRTTANHPFHVQGKGWIPASKLLPGDHLRTHDGGWVGVERVYDSGVVEPVFNLQVEGGRTYFVCLGVAGIAVLVHNDSPAPTVLDLQEVPYGSIEWKRNALVVEGRTVIEGSDKSGDYFLIHGHAFKSTISKYELNPYGPTPWTPYAEESFERTQKIQEAYFRAVTGDPTLIIRPKYLGSRGGYDLVAWPTGQPDADIATVMKKSGTQTGRFFAMVAERARGIPLTGALVNLINNVYLGAWGNAVQDAFQFAQDVQLLVGATGLVKGLGKLATKGLTAIRGFLAAAEEDAESLAATGKNLGEKALESVMKEEAGTAEVEVGKTPSAAGTAEGGTTPNKSSVPKATPEELAELKQRGGRVTRQGITAERAGVQLGREHLLEKGYNGVTFKEPVPGYVNTLEPHGIDDVLVGSDGNIYLIEYKGGTGKLSPGQMDQSWVLKKIDQLRAQGNPWGKILDDARRGGKLRGISVETPYTPGKGAGETAVGKKWEYTK